MDYHRIDYAWMADNRERWIKEICAELGPEHPVTLMFGNLSYGRHNYEVGPESTLRKEIERFAALGGYYDCVNLWCRDHDRKAQQVLLKRWKTQRQHAKTVNA